MSEDKEYAWDSKRNKLMSYHEWSRLTIGVDVHHSVGIESRYKEDENGVARKVGYYTVYRDRKGNEIARRREE